jgi:hypothetical protein
MALFDIRFEESWESDLENLRAGADPPAPVDEVVESVELVLSSQANSYPQVGSTTLRIMGISPARGLPRLNVWFYVRETVVVCCHLEPDTTQAEEDFI